VQQFNRRGDWRGDPFCLYRYQHHARDDHKKKGDSSSSAALIAEGIQLKSLIIIHTGKRPVEKRNQAI